VEDQLFGRTKYIIQKLLELSCCIIAMIAIWKLLKEENKEIEWNKKHQNDADMRDVSQGLIDDKTNKERQVSYSSSEDERYERSSYQSHFFEVKKFTYNKKFTR
jgi:hypothetical protein